MKLVLAWVCGLALAAGASAQAPSLLLASSSPTRGETALTHEQLVKAAVAFEEAINSHDIQAADAMVDGASLFRRATDGVTFDPEVLASAEDGFLDRYSMGKTIIESLGPSGDYAFLDIVEREGELRARFRLVGPGDAVNYHDMAFRADSTSQVRVVDTYPFMTGEDLSQTLRRTFVPLLTPDGDATGEGARMMEFILTYKEGDYRRAYDMYPTLTVTDDNRKMLSITYVLTSSKLGIAEYEKALDHFTSLYGADPTLDLIQIDRYYLDGNFEGALAAVNRINVSVGGDPYLDTYRITAYVGLGDLEAALNAAARLIDAYPNWDGGRTRRIDIALSLEDHDLVLQDMRVLETDFGWEFDATLIRKNWPTFASAPQFEMWRQRHNTK